MNRNMNRRSWLKLIAMAVVFGFVASIVFQISNGIMNRMTKLSSETDVKRIETDESSDTNIENSIQNDLQENFADVADEESASYTDEYETDISAELAEPTVASVAENTMASIVAITSVSVQESWGYYGWGMQEYPTTGSGSGIIVGENEEEILIATNNHVIDGAQSLSVFFVGADVEAAEEEALNQMLNNGTISGDNSVLGQIKGTDEENDLAVVAVKKKDIPQETLDTIKIAKLGDSDKLVVGQQVVAIGNAMGYGQSVTSGWVSALNRTIYMDNQTASELIQTDAAINPGNSGGALLNMQGEVIGINSAKYQSNGVEGMGYAIPISKAEPILENLMSRKTRSLVDEENAAYLGVTTAEVSYMTRQMYNIPNGVFIYDVQENGPAYNAGLQKGDVLISIDDIQVSGNELTEKMRYFEAGETVELVIERAYDGQYHEINLSVELGSRKNNDS